MPSEVKGRGGGVLLLGAGGLLGRAFVDLLGGRVVATAGRARLRGASGKDLAVLVDESPPDLVVNCAADVDAEGAESDDSVAIAANTVLPRELALVCAERGIPLIQFSSTGCYGDWKEGPYVESDPLRPTTRHHRSKALGEEAVRAAGGEHLIARVGWLYGGSTEQPRNFVWHRLVEASRVTSMVSDGYQRGCPTNVVDVARQVMVGFDAGLRGTVNIVAQGAATRASYVAEIVGAAGLPCVVHAGPAYPRKAAVSPNETACNARLSERGVDIMPQWQEGVRAYVGELMRSPAGLALRG
jgi:dTDP-4-dehydrorhamnose reductase